MITQAVILCGGRGERLNDGFRFAPAVETPKPLMEVGGKPFVTYAINMMKGVGIWDIVLLVLYKREVYEFLSDNIVRLSLSKGDVNEAVLDIPRLGDKFFLLNGDCYPVMDKTDWTSLMWSTEPVLPIKVIGRDAGIAVVSKAAIATGHIDCSKLSDMIGKYSTYTILGGLHIGTYQGLERARQYFDIVCFGQ